MFLKIFRFHLTFSQVNPRPLPIDALPLRNPCLEDLSLQSQGQATTFQKREWPSHQYLTILTMNSSRGAFHF